MVHTGKLLDVLLAGLLVETLQIALLGGLDGTLRIDLDELAFVFDNVTGLLLGITERGDHPDDNRDIVPVQ
jgi:hypothetical protein